MNEIVLYVIVFMVGGMLGIMAMSLISANKFSNMNSEIQDLRHQRQLLKTELIRKSPSKPKPRRYRGKGKNVRPK